MRSEPYLSQGVLEKIRCAVCRSQVKTVSGEIKCVNSSCGCVFPIINGIPVLINQAHSVFSFDLYSQKSPVWRRSTSGLKHRLSSLLPTLSLNVRADQNFAAFADLLQNETARPKVLVVGGEVLGAGIKALLARNIELVESDISIGDRTQIILDAHDIPFENGTFDGVIAQAVLEHVVDPARCVQEIHRVLKDRGLVYVEIPFMQQVHGGKYDFTRYTHLGLCRLLRKFEEIDSGACCGPGMAVAWSIHYFLLSFTTVSVLRSLIGAFTRLTLFWLKYLDRLIIATPGTLDAGSAFFFLGRKALLERSDKEILASYRGAM